MQLEVDTDYTDYWQQHVKKAIENVITKEFDIKTWNYDKIIQALNSNEGIKNFIEYKLNTTTTNIQIPEAIKKKFIYKDTAFFITFTQEKNTIPAHQKEFTDLQTKAILAYKQTNEITLINRKVRDMIQLKL